MISARLRLLLTATAGAPTESAKPDVNIAGRLRFESFLLELSAFFAKASTDCIEQAVDLWLEKLARFTGIDRIAFWECDTAGGQMHLRHIYSAPDFPQLPTRVFIADFPWLINEFRHGRVACWERIPEDAPAIASVERAYLTQIGAKSALGIPVEAGTTTFVLIFMCIRGPRKWPKNLIRRLQLVAEIFASAVARLRIERSLSASESRTKAILRAFPDLIFVRKPGWHISRKSLYKPCRPADAAGGVHGTCDGGRSPRRDGQTVQGRV